MGEVTISLEVLRESLELHVSEKLTFRLVEGGQVYSADIEEFAAMAELLGRTFSIAAHTMDLVERGHSLYEAGRRAYWTEYQARLDAGLNP